MLGFNIILEIGFLGRYRAKIDYQYKKVWFSLKDWDKFDFGKRHIKSMIISAIKVGKLLSKGCTGFQTHMVSKVESSLNIDEMPIIREYLDVFLKELPKLAHEREVGFSIKLMSSTTIITKEPTKLP